MAGTVDIHALSGAYALDAVDDIERAAFERHLRDCTPCAIEVAELRETTSWLSRPVAVTAPPGLRDAVLTAIHNTPQVRPARRPTTSSPASLSRWRRWGVSVVAASVLAAGVGTATWFVSEQRLRDERATNARIEALLAAPDARLVQGQMAGGRVSLIVSPSRDAAVAVLSGLAPAGPGHAYQMWMVGAGGKPVAVDNGVLPEDQGDGRAYVDGLAGAQGFAVSLEPAGGSEQPSQIVGQLNLNP